MEVKGDVFHSIVVIMRIGESRGRKGRRSFPVRGFSIWRRITLSGAWKSQKCSMLSCNFSKTRAQHGHFYFNPMLVRGRNQSGAPGKNAAGCRVFRKIGTSVVTRCAFGLVVRSQVSK